jgi:hypothetical protein
VATYHLNATVISRANGHSAVAAAAYQHRCASLDERRGLTENYSAMRNRPLFEGLYVPADAPAWARDRQKLWNAVEAAENPQTNRKWHTAQVARSFDIALPHELTPEQNRWLLQDFVRENFTRNGYAADVAIHPPHDHGGDSRNVHAHMMVSLRKLGAGGFTVKDTTEGFRELQTWRKQRADLSNQHLERHGHSARVDHRTLEKQGIDREPEIHVGKKANAPERKQQPTPTKRGTRNREIKGRNHSRRNIEKLLEELAAEQRQGPTPTSALPQEVNTNMKQEQHPVEKAFSRFESGLGGLFNWMEGAAGAVVDLTMGRGADGVPGSSAEQYPGQGNKITLEVENMNVRNLDNGKQQQQEATAGVHEQQPAASNAIAHEAVEQTATGRQEEAMSRQEQMSEAIREAARSETRVSPDAEFFANRDAEERAYYEALEREEREHDLALERERER